MRYKIVGSVHVTQYYEINQKKKKKKKNSNLHYIKHR